MKHNRAQTQAKRILSILLAILMIAVSAPMVVFAGNVVEGGIGNIHWKLDQDNRTLTITGNGAMPDFNSYKNTPWYAYLGYIQSVAIENGVTTIGEYAFAYCNNMTSISISNSVVEIRENAFSCCSNIESVSIPKNVISMEDGAFSGCTLLSSINIPKGITKISKTLFANCSSIRELVLPDSLRSIDDSAFKGCKRLETIIIPKNVVSIGNYAFLECDNLTSVTFPDSLNSLGWGAFYGCKSLKIVTVPDSVQMIDECAFRECSELTNAVFSNSLTEISGWMFYQCGKLKSFIVPNNIKVIRSHAFEQCSYLGEIFIPKSVTSIFEYAFYSCARLTDVYYEGTKEEWGAITIGKENGNLIYATIHYNADPSIWVPQGNGIYNLGEETYSFKNYGDMHSPEGHCFGMSMTSSGYYNNYLNMNIIGDSRTLYDYDDNGTVRAPICHYQDIQGSYARAAVVAGGSRYFGNDDLDADWDAALDYVRDHEYDDKGKLVIGFFIGDGGHAVNFLRYEEVDGEERIYAYDNNFPEEETYFYKDADGWVLQTPKATFSERIRSFSLLDAWTYFQSAQRFNKSRVVYAKKGEVSIDGAVASEMVGAAEAGGRMMYELPDTAAQVRIIPQTDGATFTYLEKEYRFDAVDTDTYGVLTLSATEDGTGTLVIENAPTTPDTPEPEPQNLCPWCGQEHVGFFAGIIAWFHGILARIFGARY